MWGIFVIAIIINDKRINYFLENSFLLGMGALYCHFLIQSIQIKTLDESCIIYNQYKSTFSRLQVTKKNRTPQNTNKKYHFHDNMHNDRSHFFEPLFRVYIDTSISPCVIHYGVLHLYSLRDNICFHRATSGVSCSYIFWIYKLELDFKQRTATINISKLISNVLRSDSKK